MSLRGFVVFVFNSVSSVEAHGHSYIVVSLRQFVALSSKSALSTLHHSYCGYTIHSCTQCLLLCRYIPLCHSVTIITLLCVIYIAITM